MGYYAGMELDRLIALNDEIAALARAGVPLGQGLLQSSRDLPTRLARISKEVGSQLERGKSLESAVCDGSDFPPIYSAVVAAGIRGGRLTVALEGLSSSLRRIAELRRSVSSALVYPIVVLIFALLLFAFVVGKTTVPLEQALTFHRIRVEGGWLEFWLGLVGRYATWLAIVPVFILLLYFFWTWYTGRSEVLRTSANNLAYAWLPGGPRLLRMGQLATFTNVLALLVENRVPMQEAVVLAADAADGRDLRDDARRLSDHLRQGLTQPWHGTSHTGLPTLVAWMVRGKLSDDALAPALRRISDSYQRQARDLGNWLRVALPSLATFFLAGVATFAYAAASMMPWLVTLYRLGASV